jgi:hypothetical protein
VVELHIPRERAFLQDFITRSREVAKITGKSHLLCAFAASRESNSGLSNVSAFGG